MPGKKSMLLFQRILPAYRIPVFRRLYQEFGMIPCYSLPVSSISPENAGREIDFPAIRIKRLKVGRSSTAIIQNILPVLSSMRPALVISEGAPSYLTLWLLVLLRPLFGYKLCLWSHGVKFHEMDKPFHGLRGGLQKWLFNRADALILYSDQRAVVLRKVLRKPEKIFVARNTLDTDEMKLIYEKLSEKGKEVIKNELKFKRQFNLIFIGRLLKTKGLDDLLDAVGILPEELDFELHIVGDGPEMSKLITRARNDHRIKLYGNITNPFETGKLLYASDVMIMPGYVGLSVVHSFAFGCPVITYESLKGEGPAHSPEVDYIHDKVNGIFCNPSPADLAATLEELLLSPSILADLSVNAFNTIKNEASIEIMMKGFHGMIRYLSIT